MKPRTLAIVALLLPLHITRAQSTLPAPAEIADAHRWATAKFAGRVEAPNPEPAILVLANHDAVQKNGRNGRPMHLGDHEFNHGLFCHAPSKLIVRLPGAGKTFTALAGVDSNEQTSGGRGSVDFSIHVGGVEKFRSGVMHEGMAAKPVNVELNGVTEFELRVDETPDGISCDQADWVDAKVILADGRELWLTDLALQENGARAPLTTAPPFAFTYDGKSSTDLFKTWKLERKTIPGRRGDEADLTRSNVPPPVGGYELIWTDPATGLLVRLVGFQYADFPTVEWTVYFKNTGATDSPLLEDILALDTHIERSGSREFTLHHHKGTSVRADDFEPLTTTLAAKQNLRFAPPAGRPLGQVFPYFNLEWQDEGVIAVVGWPGQWFAEFTRDSARGLHLVAGQERTHLRLKPGEEIRTPLVVLQFWKGGDWLRAQNVWRRWMVAHNLPRPGGEAPRPLLTPCSSHQFGEMIQADEASQKVFIDRYLEEKLNPDYWWMDAGWYFHYGKGWPQVGTWEVDTARFPRGLRAITDYAHAKGVKSIVWFEPERVTPGTFLYTNNPAWLLGSGAGQKLLNLGHPEALAWLINHVDRMLTEQGIDLYRQDYNVDPLNFWRRTDF